MKQLNHRVNRKTTSTPSPASGHRIMRKGGSEPSAKSVAMARSGSRFHALSLSTVRVCATPRSDLQLRPPCVQALLILHIALPFTLPQWIIFLEINHGTWGNDNQAHWEIATEQRMEPQNGPFKSSRRETSKIVIRNAIFRTLNCTE
jgi:hypothetical protein